MIFFIFQFSIDLNIHNSKSFISIDYHCATFSTQNVTHAFQTSHINKNNFIDINISSSDRILNIPGPVINVDM